MIGKVAFPAWSDGSENENMILWPTLTIKEPKIRQSPFVNHTQTHRQREVSNYVVGSCMKMPSNWVSGLADTAKRFSRQQRRPSRVKFTSPPSQGSLIYRHCRQFWFIRMFRRGGNVNTPWNENKRGERENIARRHRRHKARRDIEIERKKLFRCHRERLVVVSL